MKELPDQDKLKEYLRKYKSLASLQIAFDKKEIDLYWLLNCAFALGIAWSKKHSN